MAIEYESLQGLIYHTLGTKRREIRLDDYFDEIGVNEIDLIELILNCEDKYNLEISEEASSNFDTPRNILDYVNSYIG